MSIIGKFKKGVKKYMAEADQRAERRLAKAKTKVARDRERDKIQQESLATKREVAQAKTALLQAEAKRKKAAKEVKDIGGGDFFSGIGSFLNPPKSKRRVTRKKARKVVVPKSKKRTIRKKSRGTVTTVTRTVTRGR